MKQFFEDMAMNVLMSVLGVAMIVLLLLPHGSPAYNILNIMLIVVLILTIGRTVYCLLTRRKKRESNISVARASWAIGIWDAFTTAVLVVWFVLTMIRPNNAPVWLTVVTVVLCVMLVIAMMAGFRRARRDQTKVSK